VINVADVMSKAVYKGIICFYGRILVVYN